MLEMAVLIPFLVLLGFGVVEYGHWFYTKHILMGASREGVRAATLETADTASVTAAVDTAMSAAGYDTSDYTVTTVPGDVSAAAKGELLTVRVEAPWSGVGLSPMAMIGGHNVVRATSVMRKEADGANVGGGGGGGT